MPPSGPLAGTAETVAGAGAGVGAGAGGGVDGERLMGREGGAGTDPTGAGRTMGGVAVGAADAAGAAGVAAAAAAVVAATAVMATGRAVAVGVVAGCSLATAPKRLPSGLPLAAAGGHPGRWWRHALGGWKGGRRLSMGGRRLDLCPTRRVGRNRRVTQTGSPLQWGLARPHPAPLMHVGARSAKRATGVAEAVAAGLAEAVAAG